MKLQFLIGFVPMMFACVAVQATLPDLPINAIDEQTFFVGNLDLTKVNPALIDATFIALFGDKTNGMDDFVKGFQSQYAKYGDKGAESVSVIVHGDPNQQKPGEAIMYVEFKPGTDQAALVKQIRQEDVEGHFAALEISQQGDFMVIRKAGVSLPTNGSTELTNRFAEVLGHSEKPGVGALIFNEAMLKSMKQDLQRGGPPSMQTIVTDSKWFRIELTFGEATQGQVTIQAADEPAGKRIADAVTGLGELMKSQAAEIKKSAGKADARIVEIADAMTAAAEAYKPVQAGALVTITADAKALGGLVRAWVIGNSRQPSATPAKGGI